jgi:predicted lipid-binding transport protein (Tim44 family)
MKLLLSLIVALLHCFNLGVLDLLMFCCIFCTLSKYIMLDYMICTSFRMSTSNVSMGPPAPQPSPAGAMGPPQAPVAAATPAAGIAAAAAAAAAAAVTAAQDSAIGPVVISNSKSP